jgi:hypothetical protein
MTNTSISTREHLRKHRHLSTATCYVLKTNMNRIEQRSSTRSPSNQQHRPSEHKTSYWVMMLTMILPSTQTHPTMMIVIIVMTPFHIKPPHKRNPGIVERGCEPCRERPSTSRHLTWLQARAECMKSTEIRRCAQMFREHADPSLADHACHRDRHVVFKATQKEINYINPHNIRIQLRNRR